MTPSLLTPPPRDCGIALKEWAGVCQALGDGRQILLLRKGGLADSPGPDFLQASHFWLLPTWSHQAEQGLRPGFQVPRPSDASARSIHLLASVQRTEPVHDAAQARRLAALTAWTTDTILRRFHYRSPGLWAFLVRVYQIEQPWPLPEQVDSSGCSSWVPLDRPVPIGPGRPALEDPSFLAACQLVLDALHGNRTVRP